MYCISRTARPPEHVALVAQCTTQMTQLIPKFTGPKQHHTLRSLHETTRPDDLFGIPLPTTERLQGA